MDSRFIQDLTTNKRSLLSFVKEWNESRLDMFALSQPDENLQFSGVMRFYFQDSGQKATTKCIRVNSKQTVHDIMPTLIDKFCPDLKMLSSPNYELYEIHGTGDVRKLQDKERPLFAQLQWHNDDREGRFVLKNADIKIQPVKFFEINQDEGQLKRRLSRREKKDLKKRRKEELARRGKNQDKLLADHVYRELPESSLTRTISNPEAVMRRRRQQKLEKRMKEFQNKGGPQTGGILKIFAESLKPEIPYKTILASVKDNADVITKAALEKFLLPGENPAYYCIVMAIIPPNDSGGPGNVKERIIRSTDCPLAIQNSWPRSKGVITFHLRRKEGAPEPPAKPVKEEKKPKSRNQSSSAPPPPKAAKPPPLTNMPPPVPPQEERLNYDTMPYFLELTPEGKEISYKPKIYYIREHETVIGSSRNPSPGVQYLQLFSPKILASHCSIVNEDGSVSIVPHGPDADVRISGKRIYDATVLQNGNVVQFGGLHTFRFCNPLDIAHSEKSSIASESDYHRNSRHGFDQPYGLPLSSGMTSPPMSPISPELKEKILNEQIGTQVDDELEGEVAETTFGVDGGVETEKIPRHIYTARSAENLLDEESVQLRDDFRNSFKKHRQSAPNLLNINLNDENLLPASLTFLEHGKDAFFAAVISEVNGAAVNFKLAPTYTLYLAARHVMSSSYRPGLNPLERTRLITSITKKIANSVQQTIQENDCLAGGLAFWMANASELLHFYRQDMDLGPLTQSAQTILAQSIQESFALLVNAMEDELALALPAFLEPSEKVDIHERDLDAILNDDILERAESVELLNWTSENDDRAFRMGPNGRPLSGEQWITPAARIRHHGMPMMADVLYILSSAMSLLRRCRVNAALTIQLFSQLFHYINMWIFNRIVLEPDLQLCTRMWGHRLRMRLSFVEAWAERQGLELAADCHLARIVQAAYLLEAPKDSHEDIADISQQCFKLNSLQLRCLLQNYHQDRDEPRIPQDLIETIVAVAESTADELTISDGREVKLEEDVQLQLPFLLPEEGYSSDIIRGVPPGLQEFLEPLCGTGLCELSLNPSSMGLWTVYQEPYDLDENDDGQRDSQLVEELPIQRVTIDKGKSGLGLSICAAKGVQSDFPGIYIKAVIKGGLADKDGRLEGGDQILSVNESSLIDVTQTQAAKIMGKSGPVITLEVMKGAAFYHGLSKLVDDPPKGINHVKESSIDSGKPKMQNPPMKESSVDHYPEPPIPKREEIHERVNSYDSADYAPPIQPKPHQRNRSQDSREFNSYDAEPREPPAPKPKPKPKKEEYHERSDSYERSARAPPPVQPKPHVQEPVSSTIEDTNYVPENETVEPHQPQFNESDYDSDGNLMTPEEKARLARQRQRQREYEERLAKWEQDRIRQEEEERQAEEEAERQYEEEIRRRRAKEEEEAERKREEEERIRYEEEQRLIEEERRREEERHLAEERRQEERRIEEEKRREEKRIEEERRREEARLRAEERRREEERLREEERRYEEERRREEKRRQEEERQREEEQRRREEERLREEERRREARRREEERLREEARRKEEEALHEAEEQRKRLEAYRAEQQKLKLQRDHEEEEERRRREKLRLIEERKRKEAEQEEERRARREQVQRENEERRRRQYEEQVSRREAEDRARRDAEEKRRREEEERRKQMEYESRPKSTPSYGGNDDMDDDIAGINEAIREAEKIAAEMDLFMMEEEMKIEEGSKQKREKEKHEWQGRQSPKSYTKANNVPTNSYKIGQKVDLVIQPMKRTSSRENLLETNLDEIDSTYLPPPPEDLLSDEEDVEPIGQAETNIDSSDEEPPPPPPPQPSIAPKPKFDARITAPKFDARHLHDHDPPKRDFRKPVPPPAVRPKSFKPPISTPTVSAVKGEFKTKAGTDYERRRQVIDKDFDSSGNHRNPPPLTVQRQNSSDEDAPPRPPPPKNVTPSPRSSNSPQFNYANSNGYQDYQRSHSFGKSTQNADNSPEPAVMDFRTKMKMFNKFQN